LSYSVPFGKAAISFYLFSFLFTKRTTIAFADWAIQVGMKSQKIFQSQTIGQDFLQELEEGKILI